VTGRSLRRHAAPALAAATIGLFVAGCAPQTGAPERAAATPHLVAETAQRQMIDAVDDLTGRLGGDWEQGTGPDYAEACALPEGRSGAHWVDVRTRSSLGDVPNDLAAVEGLWEQQGMAVDRWGSTAHPTIVGRGGDRTESVSLSVTDHQYGVQAVSRCFVGDPDEL
jgi:hypothetical protein